MPIIKFPGHLSSPLKPKVARVLLKSLPIWVLGLLRLIVVKLSDYPVSQLTEYLLQRFHGGNPRNTSPNTALTGIFSLQWVHFPFSKPFYIPFSRLLLYR
jgi:hypothetical protein